MAGICIQLSIFSSMAYRPSHVHITRIIFVAGYLRKVLCAYVNGLKPFYGLTMRFLMLSYFSESLTLQSNDEMTED